MKIVDVRPMVVENDPPYIGGQHLLFVRVVTDEGIVGLGERVTGSGYSGNVGGFAVDDFVAGGVWSVCADR